MPVKTVVADFFPHFNAAKFVRKVSEGDIDLPLVRIENSNKAAKGVTGAEAEHGRATDKLSFAADTAKATGKTNVPSSVLHGAEGTA